MYSSRKTHVYGLDGSHNHMKQDMNFRALLLSRRARIYKLWRNSSKKDG